ncbi:protein of unknown function [Ruminococcaceae bacterium BL-6]|nr:protein of unknown function [Ruminococcaceae bacterium BL-6]
MPFLYLFFNADNLSGHKKEEINVCVHPSRFAGFQSGGRFFVKALSSDDTDENAPIFHTSWQFCLYIIGTSKIHL